MFTDMTSDAVEQQLAIEDPLVGEITDRVFNARQSTLTEFED
ncbi:hypothetical protein [Halobaculum sp. MBLA0143]